MMGRRNGNQGHLFYEFRLDEAVPDDHLVRKIGAVLDLSWVHGELEPYYSEVGRPSIDPVLMIRMLIVGYVFAIRSERQLCREVQVTWPIDGSANWAWKTVFPITPPSPGPVICVSARAMNSVMSSSVSWRPASKLAWSVARASPSMRALSRPMPTASAQSQARSGTRSAILKRPAGQ